MCPACNEEKGVIEESLADHLVVKVRCSACGYKYVSVDNDLARSMDEYREAVAWAYGEEMAKAI